MSGNKCNKRRNVRRFIVIVLISIMLLSLESMRHKGNIEFNKITLENVRNLIDENLFIVGRVLIEGNTLHINISNKGKVTDRKCRNVARDIFYNIKKDSLRDKRIAINFIDENIENDKIISTLYTDGLNRKLTVECNSKEVSLISFDKEKILIEDLKEENIVENKRKNGRKVTVYGEDSINELVNVQSIEQAISEINN